MDYSNNKLNIQKLLFGVVTLSCIAIAYLATNTLQQTGFPYINTTAQSQLLAPKITKKTDTTSNSQSVDSRQIEIYGDCISGKGFFVFVNQLQENIYPEYCKSTSDYTYKIDPTKNLIEGNNYIQVQYDIVDNPESLMSERLIVLVGGQGETLSKSISPNSNSTVVVDAQSSSSSSMQINSKSSSISSSSIGAQNQIISKPTQSSIIFTSSIISSGISVNSSSNSTNILLPSLGSSQVITSKPLITTNTINYDDLYKVKNISYTPKEEPSQIEIGSTLSINEIKSKTTSPSILLPNKGDGNNDSVKDIEQENIYTLETPSKDSFVTVQFDSQDPNCRIPISISTTNEYTKNDKDYQYPFGHIQFKLKCPTNTKVKIIWHGIKYEERDNYKFRKFSNLIPANNLPKDYFDFVPDFESIKIENRNLLVTRYLLTDGQYGDSSPKDGYIIDPIGATKLTSNQTALDTLARTGGFSPNNMRYLPFALFILLILLIIIQRYNHPKKIINK
jgi:hypothetical protein